MPKSKTKKKKTKVSGAGFVHPVIPPIPVDDELTPESIFAVGDIFADMKIVEIKPKQERSIGFVYPQRGKYVTVPAGKRSTSPGGQSWNPDAMITQPLLEKGQVIGEAVAWDMANVFWMSEADFEAEAKIRATKYMIPTGLVGK